uniref:U3-ctenitoxin-Pk1a n=1 Tax=Phoneutria keyserlingi TaxID=272754 RepID=TX21_PHOKE|nr:RecName: Full=U3-ctenitoxin-Pk1a; Short=U3-CNTX-Pk1a; AltName: Full=Neurotoxin PKTx21C2; Contains: RecName: Full=Neurotoxin PKTx21C2 variant Ala-1 Del [Phoneutria keyserlingi]
AFCKYNGEQCTSDGQCCNGRCRTAFMGKICMG